MIQTCTAQLIEAVSHNLNKTVPLYKHLDAKLFVRSDIAPYFSSIGMHLRHTLDIFNCITKGMGVRYIDFTARERRQIIERDQQEAYQYLLKILTDLQGLTVFRPCEVVYITDDIGQGTLATIKSTLASALTQAHSHAIHHFSSIGYLLQALKADIPIADFGYNPSTPCYAQHASEI